MRIIHLFIYLIFLQVSLTNLSMAANTNSITDDSQIVRSANEGDIIVAPEGGIVAVPDDDADEIPIYLKVRNTIRWKVKRSQTIRTIKGMFSSRQGISESLQEIFFAGEHVEDGVTLADCGIERNSTLDVQINTMSVFVRKLNIKIPSNQGTVVLMANAYDNIQHIKYIVQAITNMESDNFNLMHDGKFLEVHQTLASLAIGNDSTLYLVHHPTDELSVSVRTLTKGIIALQVKQLQTVGDVKALVGSMTDTQVDHARLVHEEKALEDSRTIVSYKFEENTLLELAYPFQIFVRLWNGKTITLEVHAYDNIMEVNAKVYKKLGLPVAVTPFYFNAKRMDENRSLMSYNIEKDSTLEMGPPVS